MTIHAVCATVGRRTCGSHAAKLVLAGELATELGKVGNEVLADLEHGLLGGDLAVRLDADEKLRHVRVGNCLETQTCQPERLDFLPSTSSTVLRKSDIDLLLYPAIRTLGCFFRCSETRLPRVWSSFFRVKSEQFDMPDIHLSALCFGSRRIIQQKGIAMARR